jgi:hypothetical protein
MNIEFLTCPGPPWEVDLGGVKRTGRGESIGAVIHICMETSKGNSLCSNLYLKLANVMFLVLSFMFFLLQNQRIGGAVGGG